MPSSSHNIGSASLSPSLSSLYPLTSYMGNQTPAVEVVGKKEQSPVQTTRKGYSYRFCLLQTHVPLCWLLKKLG